MSTLGLELSDAGFRTAWCDQGDPRLLDVPDRNGATEWPGFCYADGPNLTYGQSAEDLWFVHPRRVVHNFWARLAHEPSSLTVSPKPPSFSELAFFFLRDYASRLATLALHPEKVVIAVPGAYLKDGATEEEKVGLLLGMIGELKLPLAGIIDSACAALCDPRAPGFNRSLPVVVLDFGLDGADLTLLTTAGSLSRKDFMHMPQAGLATLLKQLTSSMGNRFLRHTAFDILEDGRIEQTFFRQTKEFLCSDAAEYRYLINTATRAYEMTTKRDQLAADAAAFVAPLVQTLQTFIRNSPHGSEPCTVALTNRAAHLPGLESRLRAAGFTRLLRLPPGSGAAGAARIGARRLRVLADLADVVVETTVDLAEARSLVPAPWEARLQKLRTTAIRRPPTHAIVAGSGRPIGSAAQFTIGLSEPGADLALPVEFSLAGDLLITLLQEDGRLWFIDSAAGGNTGPAVATASRTAIESGDLLLIRCGTNTTEVLFAHCPAPGHRAS